MAFDIGPVIGIEGEKDFRQAISQINTNMKTLNTEMMAVASQFDKSDESMESYTAKNKVLVKQIDEQKNKLAELNKGLDASSEKYGKNDKVTQGWQQAVNKATADLNKMERELGQNNSAIDEFGKEINDAANELDKASENGGKFSQTLGNLKSGMSDISGTIGKAAITGIKAVGTAAVAAGAGALKFAMDVGKTADDLITLSNQTGLSAEKLQELQYAARFVDVEVETMAAGMAKVTKAVGQANDKNEEYITLSNGLTVATKDANGQLKSSEEIFYDSVDALGSIANETEREIAAQELFGRSYQDLMPLIKEGSKGLKGYADEAHNVGAVLSDDTLAAAGQFDDMMQTLEASTKGLTATLGVAAIPAVTEVVNSIVGVVPEITKAIKTGDWDSAGKALSDAVGGLIGKITDALPGLVKLGSSLIGGIAGAIVAAVPEVLPPLIDATLMLLDTILNILIENGPMLIDAGIEAVLMLVSGLINSLPKIIEASLQLIIALANGLIQALPELIAMVPQIVQTIVDILIQNLPLIIDGALQIMVALAGALITNLPLIIKSVIEIIGAILGALLGGIVNIVTFVPKLFAEIGNGFKKIKWSELGINIINGIADGIKNAAANLANSVVNAASGALSGAKKFLKIQSPSKVFRDQVGSMIGLGMAEGITDSTKNVNAAMNGLNKGLTENKVNTNVAGSFGDGSVNIDVPVYLDGQVISKSSGRIQHGKNRTRSRALGVTV